MERQDMLPAVEKFIADLRAACAQGLDGKERWEKCRELMGDLLADPELQAHAQNWPVTGFDGKKVSNLLFYVDPDYGFALNGLIKKGGGRAMVHDHGPTWTTYGVLRGEERIVRYEVADENGEKTLREAWHIMCGPGDVDIVPPGEIHSEFAQEGGSIAFIVRSQKTGTFEQFSYEQGPEPVSHPGPTQVPYALS